MGHGQRLPVGLHSQHGRGHAWGLQGGDCVVLLQGLRRPVDVPGQLGRGSAWGLHGAICVVLLQMQGQGVSVGLHSQHERAHALDF